MATRKSAAKKEASKAEASSTRKPSGKASPAAEKSAAKKKAPAEKPARNTPARAKASSPTAEASAARKGRATAEGSSTEPKPADAVKAPAAVEGSAATRAHAAKTPTAGESPSQAPVGPPAPPAPRFVPFVMPPPKPLEVRPLTTAEPAPAWKTKATEPDQLPQPTRLEARLQLNWPFQLDDGTAIGLERGKLTEAHVVRVATDGTRTRLSTPGQFSFLALSPDHQTIFGVSGGKVSSFPASGDASQAQVVFQTAGAVWSVTPLDGRRAVLAQDGAIRLVDTTHVPWRELDAVSVKPITLPLVDAVDEGRWLVVGRSPKIHLFAVVNDRLLGVQSWVQVEGGVSVIGGRAFLYTAGTMVREEVLNLKEVHGTLA